MKSVISIISFVLVFPYWLITRIVWEIKNMPKVQSTDDSRFEAFGGLSDKKDSTGNWEWDDGSIRSAIEKQTRKSVFDKVVKKQKK